MTREECEKLIVEKLHEIAEIYLQYNPAGKYLNLTFQVNKADEAKHHYQFNNEYWGATYNSDGSVRLSEGRDVDRPIDYFESVKTEEGDSVESE